MPIRYEINDINNFFLTICLIFSTLDVSSK